MQGTSEYWLLVKGQTWWYPGVRNGESLFTRCQARERQKGVIPKRSVGCPQRQDNIKTEGRGFKSRRRLGSTFDTLGLIYMSHHVCLAIYFFHSPAVYECTVFEILGYFSHLIQFDDLLEKLSLKSVSLFTFGPGPF